MNLEGFYEIADEEGIPVIPYPLGDLEALSYMATNCKSYIGIDPEKITSKQDEKLKLSHELGHAVQGAFYNPFAACDVWQKQENRASRWAFERLVPEKELQEAVCSGFSEIWQLADYFDIPPETMAKICHYYKHHNMDFTA